MKILMDDHQAEGWDGMGSWLLDGVPSDSFIAVLLSSIWCDYIR